MERNWKTASSFIKEDAVLPYVFIPSTIDEQPSFSESQKFKIDPLRMVIQMPVEDSMDGHTFNILNRWTNEMVSTHLHLYFL